MNVRYKKFPHVIWQDSSFYTDAMGKVLVGDSSAFMSELDVEVDGVWKDMRQAFKDLDLLTDENPSEFFMPSEKRKWETLKI